MLLVVCVKRRSIKGYIPKYIALIVMYYLVFLAILCRADNADSTSLSVLA